MGIQNARSHRLQENHRNTIEIAKFAKGLLSGMILDDDGTMPNLNSATKHGELPVVVKGIYSRQLDYAISHVKNLIDLNTESVAFLKPLGGKWFATMEARLRREAMDFVSITRNSEWPTGSSNIALSTMHSAKGLEFDHVIILGLSAQVTPHGSEEEDDQLSKLRRMLAMAVARARKTVVIGYKPDEVSSLAGFFERDTFTEVSN